MRRQYYYTEKPKQLIDLPMDIVVDILLRLPVKSLCCIRRVSKSLLKTVDSLSFVKQHTLSLIAATSHAVQVPQLMCFALTILHGDEDEDFATLQSLKYDGSALTEDKYAFSVSRSNPIRTDYRLYFVFYNLFCFGWEDENCLLINPLREGEVLRLPTSNNQQLTNNGPDSEVQIGSNWYGMGFDSITSTYKIVRVSEIVKKKRYGYYNRIGMVAHILVLGTNLWREIPSVPPSGLNCPCVCAYGDMHWLKRRVSIGAGKSHIISFDFKKEEFYWTPTPPKLHKHSYLNFLTLRGSMAFVETCSSPRGMNIEIWVLKDYAKKEWTREYTIKVDMHPKFGLKDATCGEWEHGIFFNDFDNCFNSYGATRFFLDLRCASINPVICPLETHEYTNIMSYTGSFISLKDYGNLGDANEPRELVT